MNTTAALRVPNVINLSRLTIEAPRLAWVVGKIADSRSGLSQKEVRRVHVEWEQLLQRPESEWREAAQVWAEAAQHPKNMEVLSNLQSILEMEEDLEDAPAWVEEVTETLRKGLIHAEYLRNINT